MGCLPHIVLTPKCHGFTPTPTRASGVPPGEGGEGPRYRSSWSTNGEIGVLAIPSSCSKPHPAMPRPRPTPHAHRAEHATARCSRRRRGPAEGRPQTGCQMDDARRAVRRASSNAPACGARDAPGREDERRGRSITLHRVAAVRLAIYINVCIYTLHISAHGCMCFSFAIYTYMYVYIYVYIYIYIYMCV